MQKVVGDQWLVSISDKARDATILGFFTEQRHG